VSAVIALVLGWSSVSPVAQQTPRIDVPAPNQAFQAGPDFATDVYHDPWDFSNIDDLGPFPDELRGWTVSSAGLAGRAVFLSPPSNPNVFLAQKDASGENLIPLLFRGGSKWVNAGRTGADDGLSIPTAAYRKLAIKMRLGPQATLGGGQLLGLWYHRSYESSDDLNNAGGVAFGFPRAGWAVYTVDLTTLDWTDQNGAIIRSQGPVSVDGTAPEPFANAPLVRGFAFRPTSQPGAMDVEVDWVRLTASDGASNATTMMVTHAGCNGTYALKVTDVHATPFSVMGGAQAPNPIPFNYGILAPGAYSLTLTCGGINSAAVPFVVNTPPQVTVIDPDAAGGADFATDVLNNAWDMADAADAPRLFGVTGASVVTDAGIPALQATNTSAGDPQIVLLNGGGLINTGKYRLLTFTLTLDAPFGLDGSRGEGSLARVLWSQTGLTTTEMTTTTDMLVWPGRNTYTIDLGALSAAGGGIVPCTSCGTLPWPGRSMRYFRIDPHEATNPVTFRLAAVGLRAYDQVADGQTFPIRYSFTDLDSTGSTYRAEIFADTNRDGVGLVPLGSQTVTPGAQTLNFNPASVSSLGSGLYYILVRITETRQEIIQVSQRYSSGVLRVLKTPSSPQTTLSNPTANSAQTAPFNITGCAYDSGQDTGGLNVDDLTALAIAGPNTGPQAGTTQILGLGNTLGTLRFAPLTPTTPVVCPAIANPASPYRNSGFSIDNISGLNSGNWTLRLSTRSTLSGEFTTLPDVPFTVVNNTGAPSNFTASAVGNTVTISFSAPPAGAPPGGYSLEASRNETFNPMAFSALIPTAGTYSGQLPNGVYYLRVISLGPGGSPGAASVTRQVVVGPPPATPPGQPTLNPATVTGNNVTLRWSPGGGGAPTSYTIVAGTTPGGTNLGTYPMGGATTVSAAVGNGVYFVRVIAANGGGSATSNEINFTVGPTSVPGAPTLNNAIVSGRNVTLSWSAPAGTESYTIRARLTPGGPVIASLTLTGNTITVPAGPGTYLVTIAANNSLGSSAESNQITVSVP
jgi:hypothetical protein